MDVSEMQRVFFDLLFESCNRVRRNYCATAKNMELNVQQ